MPKFHIHLFSIWKHWFVSKFTKSTNSTSNTCAMLRTAFAPNSILCNRGFLSPNAKQEYWIISLNMEQLDHVWYSEPMTLGSGCYVPRHCRSIFHLADGLRQLYCQPHYAITLAWRNRKHCLLAIWPIKDFNWSLSDFLFHQSTAVWCNVTSCKRGM